MNAYAGGEGGGTWNQYNCLWGLCTSQYNYLGMCHWYGLCFQQIVILLGCKFAFMVNFRNVCIIYKSHICYSWQISAILILAWSQIHCTFLLNFSHLKWYSYKWVPHENLQQHTSAQFKGGGGGGGTGGVPPPPPPRLAGIHLAIWKNITVYWIFILSISYIGNWSFVEH